MPGPLVSSAILKQPENPARTCGRYLSSAYATDRAHGAHPRQHEIAAIVLQAGPLTHWLHKGMIDAGFEAG